MIYALIAVASLAFYWLLYLTCRTWHSIGYGRGWRDCYAAEVKAREESPS